ncbi:MAG: DNA mismatch repair protein MutS [Candidatus Marinimicrobia bacterium]|nr:DNA mismatch repair protein MutS [Candidatus Neomarinimicrobiota bacterium]
MSSTLKAATPLMKQFLEIKNKYPDTLLLFRMGDFYETFDEDAKLTAKILGIVLTKRSNGTASDVPLAGFPYHAIDNYLPKLVKAGHRIAICEQIEDPKLAKGIVKRDVVEIVTPGTLISDQALNQKSNKYIASLYFNSKNNRVGYAILDQSTGEFFLGESMMDNLLDPLRKFGPSEVLLSKDVVYSFSDWYKELRPFITQLDPYDFYYDQGLRLLTDHFNVKSLKGFGCEKMVDGISAAGGLFFHVTQNLSSTLNHVSKIQKVQNDELMGLDGFTIKNLEVFHSLATQGTHGTLIDTIDGTFTPGGGRLLKRWLFQPITDRKVLNKRLDVIESFLGEKRLLKQLQLRLKNTTDIERILGKLNKEKCSPREMVGLSQTLSIMTELKGMLKETNHASLKSFSSSFVNAKLIITKVDSTINENAPINLKDGGVIQDGIHSELDELRGLLKGGKDWIKSFEVEEKERLKISSLKVSFNKVFGYYIEVTKVHAEKVPDSYIRKQTLVNSERYITEELKLYEDKVLNAEEKIFDIESKLFAELSTFVLENSSIIQTNAYGLNRLDLLANFANLALTKKYCRPILTDGPELDIKGGRHPVVEELLPSTEKFIPNDLSLNGQSSQIHLITGPNMAGKSTFLRQTGLIVLLAQIGSFVPAKQAKIGIVDQLFTRVGASDNLAGGESTFLVEMNEAANILNNATSKSLVLLDEIGRGTATFDGLSLAWAITEYLHNEPSITARTLFATHYHELSDLENTLDRLENYHVEVQEFGDKIVFLRKISKGSGDKSYGIHVAKMAGLPLKVINRAKEILHYHVSNQSAESGNKLITPASNQVSLFDQQESKLKEALSLLDINKMTPLQALEKLDEIKKDHGL